MSQSRLASLFLLLLSGAISIVWGFSLERTAPLRMLDFKGVYYTARCLLQNRDPYSQSELLQVYQREAGELSSESPQIRRVVTLNVYLPTTFAFTALLALLPFGPAHIIWMVLTAACLMVAAFLVWSMSSSYAPGVSILLVSIWLANCEVFFTGGNSAGIVISLCIIAVWCFLRQRLVLIGILCLAVGLAIKPHDVGLVWLYFLLADRLLRKRALQSLLLAAILCAPSLLWVTYVSPNWIEELRSNLAADSASGGNSTPGPAAYDGREPGAVIDLQSALSVFRDDPHVYNLISYLVCGVLLIVWGIVTLRSRYSLSLALPALAAISALSMLPFYHRQYDCKLLLLTVPACAMTWADGRSVRWAALILNGLGILFTAEIPLAILLVLSKDVHISHDEWYGKIMAVVLTRPIPILLLMVAVFYLWLYIRKAREQGNLMPLDGIGGNNLAGKSA